MQCAKTQIAKLTENEAQCKISKRVQDFDDLGLNKRRVWRGIPGPAEG